MKKSLTVAATGVLLAGTLSACGSSAGNKTAGQAAQTGQEGGFSRTQGRFPGTSGTVAAVSGKTAQVQSSDSQTAVTWNASTTFSQEKKVSASAVTVGACVVAMPARRTSSAGSTSSDSSTDSSTVAAATVRIISASGDCTGGTRVGFGGGTPPSGMPSGAPTDLPSGAPSGRGGLRLGAVGKVTAVSGSGFTVESDRGGSTSTVAVTTSSSTTYTATAKASAADVKVGSCLTAQGSTDSTGAVTARRVSLSPAVDGSCTFGGGFGGFPGGAAPGQQGTTTRSS